MLKGGYEQMWIQKSTSTDFQKDKVESIKKVVFDVCIVKDKIENVCFTEIECNMKINEKVFLAQTKKPSKYLKQWEILKQYLS